MASGLGVSQWRQGVRSASHRVTLHCTWTRLRHTGGSPGPKDGRRSLASLHPTARGRGAPDIPSNVSTLLPPRRAKATPRKGPNRASVVGTARCFQIMAWCKWRDHRTLSPCYCCPSCCYPLPSYNEQPPPHCQSSSGHIHSIQEAGMPSASLLKIGRMKFTCCTTIRWAACRPQNFPLGASQANHRCLTQTAASPLLPKFLGSWAPGYANLIYTRDRPLPCFLEHSSLVST